MPPATTQAFIPQVCPNEWNSGSAPNITVPAAPTSKRSRDASQLRSMLLCVSSAPFGVPVVPDV